MDRNFSVVSLASYPIDKGISAPFVGIVEGQLIVVGGCNFPNKPAAEGGGKKFYDDIYALDVSDDNLSDKKWVKLGSLPYSAAYGAYVVTSKGLLCIGGQNEETVLSKVSLIRINQMSLEIDSLPDLPSGIVNASAVTIGNKIFVTGGKALGQSGNVIWSLDLTRLNKGWTEVENKNDFIREQALVLTDSKALFLAGGYDEAQAQVFNDILYLDKKQKEWSKSFQLFGKDNKPHALIGASAIPYRGGYLFVGGVNYERFVSALHRIASLRKAQEDNDESGVAQLKEAGKEYMSHNPEWYNFNKELYFFDFETNKLRSLGCSEKLARAGAGVARWKDKLFIVCGELKPGIRTEEVNCINLNSQ